METTDFASELVRLARAEAATPEGRARLVRALRRTLAVVEKPGRAPLAAYPVTPAFIEVIDQMAASLILAADHAEWLAEKARALMPPAPRPRPQRPRSAPADTSRPG